MLRVLTLSTLFPDAARPELGRFVARQTIGLSELSGVDVRVVAPRGLPPDRSSRWIAIARSLACPSMRHGRGSTCAVRGSPTGR